jgi:CO/xanthine dehydrogenase Mo-binding subunit
MVTRLAQALDLDPITFRLQNIYREGSREPTQNRLPAGVSAAPVLERCVEEAARRREGAVAGSNSPSPAHRERGLGGEGWSRLPATAPHVRRGFGIACGIKNVGYSFGYPEQSTATVELFGGGDIERAIVRVGAADVGQGSHLALRQIAAERLGIAPTLIEMVTDDSSESPNAGSASASRMTLMGGRAVNDAAASALEKWRNSDDLHVEATVQFRPSRTTPLEPGTGVGVPNYSYGYAAQAVEVEVNLLTGQVQVLSVISVHDVGRAINRQQVEGQIEGCLAQALGYTLLENFQIRDGHVLTPYFSTYLLPTSLDMPTEIVPVILELADPEGPYGARGVAEMPLVPFAPAVAVAIHDATGAWLSQLPMTPDRVLGALATAQEPAVAAD